MQATAVLRVPVCERVTSAKALKAAAWEAFTAVNHRCLRIVHRLTPYLRGGKVWTNMKTTNGSPCNEYYHTVKAKKDRIIYRFVTQDSNTPSSCAIRLGDMDPLTGEPISDIELFMEYHRMADHEIYVQGKETQNRLSLDGLTFDNGDDQKDHKTSFSTPAVNLFDDDLPEDILCLMEIARSLTGRLADVYDALLVSYAGGKEKLSMRKIADKWNVHISQVYKDKDKIIRMIRKAVEETRKEAEE